MTETYSNVDGSSDVRAALDWQDRVDAWPQVRAYKRQSYAEAADLQPILDVGCGTGHDLVELGDRAIGVDRSAAMVARARERANTVAVADAADLPFRDATFGSTRADRVLQHLVDPMAAVAEMIRVTRAGGRVVVADPDQGSLVIHVPGVRPDLVEHVKDLRRDVGYRNGTLARSLPAAFRAGSLIDVTLHAFPLVLTDPDDAFGLPTWVEHWRERGHPFDAADVDEWAAGVASTRRSGFVYAVLYFVVSGTVP